MVNHPMIANIWKKAISIFAGNFNLGLGYLFTTVTEKASQNLKSHRLQRTYEKGSSYNQARHSDSNSPIVSNISDLSIFDFLIFY